MRARAEAIELQLEAERAQVNYQHAIRRLHAGGATLREIAEALGMSHQRVHQIVEAITGKTALKESAAARICSFCGGSSHDVQKLIAGPGVFICDGCIAIANEVIETRVAHGPASRKLSPIVDRKTKCSFCGKRSKTTSPLVAGSGYRASQARRPKYGGPGVRICGDCLELCNEIVDEERVRA